jgi:hypothetical protein
MAALIRLSSIVSLVCLLWASTASAANTRWDFDFAGSPAAPSIGVGLHIDPPAGFIGQFTSPDGLSTGIFNNEMDSGAGQSYSSLSQFQTSSTNPNLSTWSLTTGNSQYQFTPDFSGVTADSIPQIAITSPSAGATTGNQPTFQWSLSGTPNGEIVQITNADLSVNEIFFGLIPTSTSFTPPAALPPGDYTVFLSWSAAVVNIPVTTTHVSGPVLTITPNGTFQASGEAFESFTVVPEPTGLALAASASLIFLCRRARNHRHR